MKRISLLGALLSALTVAAPLSAQASTFEFFAAGLSMPLLAGVPAETSYTWPAEVQVAQSDISPCFEWDELALDFAPSPCKSLTNAYVREGYLPRTKISRVAGCYGPACPSYQ